MPGENGSDNMIAKIYAFLSYKDLDQVFGELAMLTGSSGVIV